MAGWSCQTLLHRLKTYKLSMNVAKNNLGLGFVVISVLCAICGKWISIPPIRIRPSNICYYILQLYSFSSTIIGTLIFTTAVYILQAQISEFTIFIYFLCGFIGQTECCL
jgi:hypothetical protein